MLVPGSATAVGSPAISDAVRHAAVAGLDADDLRARLRAEARRCRRQRPDPGRDEDHVEVALRRQPPRTAWRSRRSPSAPGPDVADVGDLEAPSRRRGRRRAHRVLVVAFDDDELGALGGDRLAARGRRAGRAGRPGRQATARRDMCDRAAVVAGAGGDQRAHAGPLAQRPLDGPRRAEHLERRQPEPVGLVLDRDRAEAELGCDPASCAPASAA